MIFYLWICDVSQRKRDKKSTDSEIQFTLKRFDDRKSLFYHASAYRRIMTALVQLNTFRYIRSQQRNEKKSNRHIAIDAAHSTRIYIVINNSSAESPCPVHLSPIQYVISTLGMFFKASTMQYTQVSTAGFTKQTHSFSHTHTHDSHTSTSLYAWRAAIEACQ